MKLDRDEFVVTFDQRKASTDELNAIIRRTGYTSYVPADDVPLSDEGTKAGSLNDPVYIEALTRAKREGKPMVIDFMASWCVPCLRMEKETFAAPAVAKLLERVVFVKVDTDEHPELARAFEVEGLPDIRLLSADGTEIRTLKDFQDAELFTETIEKLLSEASNR